MTNVILAQATVPVLRLLKIPIGIVRDEDDDAAPQAREAVAPSAYPSAQVGRLHRLWRRVDEVYIKPLFGGRKRGGYRVQVCMTEKHNRT